MRKRLQWELKWTKCLEKAIDSRENQRGEGLRVEEGRNGRDYR